MLALSGAAVIGTVPSVLFGHAFSKVRGDRTVQKFMAVLSFILFSWPFDYALGAAMKRRDPSWALSANGGALGFTGFVLGYCVLALIVLLRAPFREFVC